MVDVHQRRDQQVGTVVLSLLQTWGFGRGRRVGILLGGVGAGIETVGNLELDFGRATPSCGAIDEERWSWLRLEGRRNLVQHEASYFLAGAQQLLRHQGRTPRKARRIVNPGVQDYPPRRRLMSRAEMNDSPFFESTSTKNPSQLGVLFASGAVFSPTAGVESHLFISPIRNL